MKNVVKLLEAALTNISHKTSLWLDYQAYEGRQDLIVMAKDDSNWLIPVEADNAQYQVLRAKMPEDLQQVMDFARSQDCRWVMFDSFFEPVEGLPVYDLLED